MTHGGSSQAAKMNTDHKNMWMDRFRAAQAHIREQAEEIGRQRDRADRANDYTTRIHGILGKIADEHAYSVIEERCSCSNRKCQTGKLLATREGQIALGTVTVAAPRRYSRPPSTHGPRRGLS